MKEQIMSLLDRSMTPGSSRLIVREYLQARVLEALQRTGAFQNWAFLGGTALRFLYGLPRFSEDLDFSCLESTAPKEDLAETFRHVLKNVEQVFRAEAYSIDIRIRPKQIVQSAFVGFPGLLYELGLSAQREQKISIKIEIDTNPPPHADVETSVIRKYVFLNLLHYDRSSLFAGKLHALLSRSYIKGRDVFDLLWYLTAPDWPEPNMDLLLASLRQTGSDLGDNSILNWRRIISDRVMQMDWSKVVADVRPFLERDEDVEMLTRENLLSTLAR